MALLGYSVWRILPCGHMEEFRFIPVTNSGSLYARKKAKNIAEEIRGWFEPVGDLSEPEMELELRRRETDGDWFRFTS